MILSICVVSGAYPLQLNTECITQQVGYELDFHQYIYAPMQMVEKRIHIRDYKTLLKMTYCNR